MDELDNLLRIAAIHGDVVEYVHADDLNFASVRPTAINDCETDWAGVRVLRIRYALDGRTGYADLAQVSNHESILRDFGTFVREISYGGDYGLLAILDADPKIVGSEEWDEDEHGYLLDALVGLYDYPLYDESDYSQLECDTEDECWKSYGRDDLRRELARAGHEDAAEAGDDELDAAWYEARSLGNIYAEFEGTSTYWSGLADASTLSLIVRHLAEGGDRHLATA